MNLDSKYFDRLRTKRKRPASAKAESEAAAAVCQWDGCNKPAKHRAPVGRNAEGQFFMFCFEHVKAYNKGYRKGFKRAIKHTYRPHHRTYVPVYAPVRRRVVVAPAPWMVPVHPFHHGTRVNVGLGFNL